MLSGYVDAASALDLYFCTIVECAMNGKRELLPEKEPGLKTKGNRARVE